MSSNPKIFVFKARDVVYSIVLVFFVAVLLLCLFLMFTPPKEQKQPDSLSASVAVLDTYLPGIYTTGLSLGSTNVDLELSVDKHRINYIRLMDPTGTVNSSFPLLVPCLEHISSQILETQKLEGITCPQENRYTSQLLLSAISRALDHARTA